MMGLLAGIVLTIIMLTMLLLAIDPIYATDCIHPKE